MNSKINLLPHEIASKIFGYLNQRDKFIYEMSVNQRILRNLTEEEEKIIDEEKKEMEAYYKEIEEEKKNYVFRIRNKYELDDNFNVKEWDKIIIRNKGKQKIQIKFNYFLRQYVNNLLDTDEF